MSGRSRLRRGLSPELGRELDAAVAAGPLRSGHFALIATCMLISIADGFDMAAISFALPAIGPQLQLTPGQMGTALSSAIVGAMLGALGAVRLEDRLGRKLLFCASLLWFALGSLAMVAVESYGGLLLVRFLTGLGLGLPIPIMMATVGDSVPARARGRAWGLCVSGVPVGGLLVSFTSVALMPEYGWQAIFWVGMALPLAIIPIVFAFISEAPARIAASDQPRVAKARAFERLGLDAALLDRLKGELLPVVRTERAYGALFTAGRMAITLPILNGVFLSSLLVYFLINWIPSLMTQGHEGLRQGALGGGFLSAGMIVATMSFGYLIDKFGVLRVVTLAFVAAAPLILSLGSERMLADFGFAPLFLAGMFAMGAQLGCSLLIVTRIPVELRTAGSGLAYVTARLGAISGPFIVGILLDANMTAATVFALAAAVALASAINTLIAAQTSRSMISGNPQPTTSVGGH